MKIVRVLLDYANSGFLYCLTIATPNENVLYTVLHMYSDDVRFLDTKNKPGKNDTGHRVLPDGSIILGARAFGDKCSANTAFEKSENKMRLIRRAVEV